MILDADTEHPFITERPEDLMKNKNLNMDMMIGYTTQVCLLLFTFSEVSS